MVKDRVEGLAWLRKQLETADVDLLREMVGAMAETLMGAEADSLCGAAYGQSGPERVSKVPPPEGVALICPPEGGVCVTWESPVGAVSTQAPTPSDPFGAFPDP
ncbi:MAG: hypothetical protein V1797_00195, partial [Pseudomonadota bacterium]